jgi:hypothetical protein
MTDENRSPPGGPDGRRKRPPTVLDLEATDVTPAAAASEPPTDAVAAADAPPVPPPDVAAAPASEAEPTPSEPSEPEPSAAAGSRDDNPPKSWVPEGWSWTHIGAGVAGATGGLLVFLLLWLGGALPGVRDASPDVTPQLAAIQKQLNELAARPQPASVDPRALDALAQRLAKVESAQSTPRAPVADPALGDRIAAAEGGVKSLSDNLATLSRRDDALEAALSQRGGALERAVRDANTRIETQTATLAETQTTIREMQATIRQMQSALREVQAGSDRSARLALAAAMLRDAAERGDPFTAELAVVKPLAPDSPDVALLEPFAVSGLPSDAALGRELAALVRPMLAKPAEASTSGGGFLDRLQANAEKLVRVTPVGEARGDDRSAVLSRINDRAAHGNISGATAEIAKLPADARAPFQPWLNKAQAGNKALDAARRLAAGAVAALKPAP